MSKQVGMLVLGIGVGILGVMAMSPASAESAPKATCKMFAGQGLGGTDKPELRVVNAKNAASAVESWVNEQLAGGRTEFVSSTMFTNGGVICAF